MMYAEYTAWRVSVFGVFPVRILLHSDQKNSEYGPFLRSDNTNNQIKFKTTMLKPSLCNYGDVYKIIGTIYWSQYSNLQFIWVNINQKHQCRTKTSIWITSLIRVSKKPTNVLFYRSKIMLSKREIQDALFHW